MASSNVCWGIEIGSGAVKALKLVRDGDGYKAEEFVVIPHARPLSSPDIDPMDAKRVALGALVSQHNLTKDNVAVSVPGNQAFARFAKLPPVEPKKVPDIVKFEAVQQIPFPIEEVEWDYQTFVSEDSPEVEVGIFAITREKVMELLRLCADVGIEPKAINISPVSVYNAIAFDEGFTSGTEGVAIVDIGTQSTDLIVAEAGRVWIRTFPMGGHAFTEALVSSFKLPYPKAEKLKLQAERSKHKRHIFQAMRSTFSDFGQEVQRSLNYYEQLHPDANIKRIIGLGSTWKLLGLRKYVAQQLGVEVTRLTSFHKAQADGARESDFNSVAINMATCYGLALQGMGQETINANLMPREVERATVWRQKTPWFAAAAALALIAGGASFIGPLTAGAEAEEAASQPGVRVVQDVKRISDKLKTEAQRIAEGASIGATVQNVERLLSPREVYPELMRDIGAMLASADPQRELLAGDLDAVPPAQWRLFEVKSLETTYVTPAGGSPAGTSSLPGTSTAARERESRGGGGGGGLGGALGSGREMREPRSRRGREAEPEDAGPSIDFGAIQIRLVVETYNEDRLAFVDRTLIDWLKSNADRPDAPYTFVPPSGTDVVMETIDAGTRPNATPRTGRGSAPPVRDVRTVEGEDAGPAVLALEEIAPIEDPGDAAPVATKYRFTITWLAPLKNPDAPDEGDGGQVAAAGGGGR